MYVETNDIPTYYQILISLLPKDADEALMDQAIDLLVDLGVIEASEGAVTPAGDAGFGPGPHWEAAIVECDEAFLNLEVNAVVGDVGRTIVDPGGFETSILCPECLQPRPCDASWRRAATNWIRAAGPTQLECHHCGVRTSVDDWAYDPPVGFGNFVITFWNWPSINREFINRVQRLLGEHVSLIEGKGTSISTLASPIEPRSVTEPEPR